MKNLRTLMVVLLSTAAFGAVWPAFARDLTLEILDRPASSLSFPEEGAKTPPPPAKEEEAVKTEAPLPPVAATREEPAAEEPAPAPAMEPAPVAAQPSENFIAILADAYANSPVLRAEREVLRQQYEEVTKAEANWRPNISLEGGVTAQFTDTKPGTDDTFVTKDASLAARQYLYRGGRTLAEVDRQLALSDAAQAAYDTAVQSTLLGVVTSVLDMQRDLATIELNEKNREVLSNQLSAAQKGFEVGELTRTDVAQAQARLSGAEADIVAAKSSYANAQARYREYAGADAADIKVDLSSLMSVVPPALEEALSTAMAEHPAIRAAQQAELAAQKAVSVAEGALLPTVTLNGELSQAWDPSAILDESRGASLGVRASMPLYEGGATQSAIRQAKIGTYEKRNRVDAAKKTVEQAVTTAWNDYQSAKAQIDAYQRQVDAAELARTGVYREREVGLRTILDTLNADAELLDAKVGLVRAQRDAVHASFSLMSAMGGLTASKLGLTTAPDTNAYLETARANLLGTSTQPIQ